MRVLLALLSTIGMFAFAIGLTWIATRGVAGIITVLSIVFVFVFAALCFAFSPINLRFHWQNRFENTRKTEKTREKRRLKLWRIS